VIRGFIIGAGILCSLFGCGPEIVIEEKKDLGGTWHYRDVQTFQFDISDTLPAHDIVLEVKHQADFPFQNIYTKVKTVFPDQQTAEHLVSLNLTNENNQWVGDCDQKTCTVKLMLSENIYFNKTGKYLISIEQYGRKDSLSGVESLNFQVTHHQKS
jgi:gliding motility-associated lipoprotein GldH